MIYYPDLRVPELPFSYAPPAPKYAFEIVFETLFYALSFPLRQPAPFSLFSLLLFFDLLCRRLTPVRAIISQRAAAVRTTGPYVTVLFSIFH